MERKQATEDELLLQFKERVKPLLQEGKFLHEDHFLRKWLIARDWNVDAAATMFTESEQFKQEMEADSLCDWQPPQVLQEFYCGGIVGHDKLGQPVKFATTNLDMRGLMMSCRRRDVIRLRLRECELVVRELERQTKLTGRLIDKMVVVFDQTHASEMLWGPARDLHIYLAKMLDNNYPEMLDKMFIVNAPFVFPLVWKMIRPFIAEKTRNKIRVLDGNYKSELLNYIEPDQLPAAYGGVKTDENGDHWCSGILGPQGLKVPESLYITESDGLEDAETATVPSREMLTVDVEVEKAGSFLRFEFGTRGFDIAFGIAVTDSDGKRWQVTPLERKNSHLAPETGTLLCDRPGTYSLVFDNTFSWTRDKLLRYKAEVTPPEADETRKAELAAMKFADCQRRL